MLARLTAGERNAERITGEVLRAYSGYGWGALPGKPCAAGRARAYPRFALGGPILYTTHQQLDPQPPGVLSKAGPYGHNRRRGFHLHVGAGYGPLSDAALPGRR